jgi:plastocyanin
MFDHFDSRALRPTDCYGQRFMRAGAYRYGVLPAGARFVNDHRPFVIHVEAGDPGKAMAQHNVGVTFAEGEFRADPAELRIATGDLVLWNSSGDHAVPYSIAGDKDFIDSTKLVNESGYTHAFGFAGEYAWTDAHGSGAGGSERVKDPQRRTSKDYERWREQLAKGALVTITEGKAEPAALDVMVGQTVFFLVVKGPGISITDRRLVQERAK